jgi:predicted restriction endonuclease
MRKISQEEIEEFDKSIEMAAIQLTKYPLFKKTLEDPVMRKEIISTYRYLGLYDKLLFLFSNQIARRLTKRWREFILRRDNYTCQICHQKSGNLEAHHIKAFSRDFEARFDVDNGLTLCEDCHKLVHKSAFIWV